MHRLEEGHGGVGREIGRVQIVDDALGDARGDALAVGREGSERTVPVVRHIIERGDVKAVQLRGAEEKLALRQALFAALVIERKQLGQRLLPLSDGKDIEEVGHRLGVIGTGTAAEDKRRILAAFARQRRNAGQQQHIDHVGITQLVLHRKGHDIEGIQRVAAFERVQLCTGLAQRAFHVRPGRETALAAEEVQLVQHAGEDLHPQIGHADLVRVGEAEAHPHGCVFL